MSVNIQIQVPEKTINEIERVLDNVKGKSQQSVLKTAVNNTAKEARKLLAQRASKEYVGQASRKTAITSRSSITKATTSSPSAVIKFRSPVHDIKQFHVSSLEISRTTYRKDGKRGGRTLKGNVLKGSPKPLEYAFVVQFRKNKHIAVVSRVPGTKMDSNSKKEKLRKLLSPSDKAMIGSDKVYGASQEEIAELLDKQVRQVMEKVLGGG